jgi:hypothetical protein
VTIILSVFPMPATNPTLIPSRLAYLTSTEGAALLRQITLDARDDLALAGSAMLRALEPWKRAALLEQRALRAKAARKQPRAQEMLFTALGQQQMTAEAVAIYKAGRLPAGVRAVADLCCGLGGDSMRLPADVSVLGVDLSEETLRAWRHNTALYRSPQSSLETGTGFTSAVRADVTRFEPKDGKVDGVFVDPARRTLAESYTERDFDAEPEPGWEALAAITRRFGNAALKLGPGTRLPDLFGDAEHEYIGLRDECLELTVRTGAFGRPGWVRAAELSPDGAGGYAAAVVEAPAVDLDATFGHVAEPGEWFYEPVKSVVRAHLFGVVAQEHGLWQLDGRLAYLGGDARVESPLLKRYRLIKVLPCDEAVLKAEVKAGEVGTLEIKKRGLDIKPEDWRKKLKPKGPNAATLVFTRLQGKPSVLWVERE